MKYDSWNNLVEMFFEVADAKGDAPFLWHKRDRQYHPTSFAEAARQARAMARALVEMGVAPGDRVMIVSENRPEWLIADVAIMMAGGITVPAYTTNTEEDHQHILGNSEPVGVIYSTPRIGRALLPALADRTDLKFTIRFQADGDNDSPVPVQEWNAVIERGTPLPMDEVTARSGELKRDDTACFIYTSGTGGVPKGVMLSHGAILCNCKGAHWLLEQFGLSDETFLSFLPLSHSYEHSAGQFFPISIGAQIYYAESVEHLASNLLEVRPTIMTAVPRLYESLHRRITSNVTRGGGFKAKLFEKTVEIGRKRYENPSALSLGDRLTDPVLDKLVRRKVADRFGGRLKALISGGAPLNYEIGVFFTALGVQLLQGYGQTESGPVVSCNPPQRNKMRTVGPPLPDVEVKIAEDGEILVRGELVMKGYWRDEEATASTIRDGWLHTGDVGRLDEDGHIQITDRKKDIIVLSGGDNVAPQRVEGFLCLRPEIAQAMVYGDKRPHLVAALVPDQDWLKEWARANDRSVADIDLDKDPDLRRAMEAAISEVNKQTSILERVRTFLIVEEPFSIDNGMMTPTMKIRRHMIKDTYGDRLEALY